SSPSVPLSCLGGLVVEVVVVVGLMTGLAVVDVVVATTGRGAVVVVVGAGLGAGAGAGSFLVAFSAFSGFDALVVEVVVGAAVVGVAAATRRGAAVVVVMRKVVLVDGAGGCGAGADAAGAMLEPTTRSPTPVAVPVATSACRPTLTNPPVGSKLGNAPISGSWASTDNGPATARTLPRET